MLLFVVSFNVNSAFLPVAVDANGGSISQKAVAGGVVIQLLAPDSQAKLTAATTTTPATAYTFSIIAPSNLSSAQTTSIYTITYGNNNTSTGSIAVPLFANPDQITGLSEIAADESTVDVLLGVGSHIAFGDYPDYNLSANNVLVSTGIGHAIPEMLLGAGFTTGAYKLSTTCAYKGTPPKRDDACIFWKKVGRHALPDSIFINVQIPLGSGSSSGSISGYTFGGGYKIQKFVEILIGFSLAQYNEPSPGFEKAAAAIVTANAALPAAQQVPLYLQYSAPAILASRPNSLDGFPTLLQNAAGAPGASIYSGAPLLNHYRGGLFLGLAYPFSLSKLFQPH